VDRRLLDEEALAASAVVANCAMNRERQLVGANSYARELGFDPLDLLRARLTPSDGTTPGWLDLCCGTGRALVQAARQLSRDGLADRVTLVGVDLVDYFDPTPVPNPPLQLCCAALSSWTPTRRHRITCTGRRELSLPYVYLGADDRAGPNYTNQPAVDSYYQRRR
jgi:hypothetical protein